MMNEPMHTDEPLLVELIAREKSVMEAYRLHDVARFTEHFAPDYISIANDGVKDTQREVDGMLAVEVKSLAMVDEQALMPTEDTVIITYTMQADAIMNGKRMTGDVYTATVYVRRDGRWQSTLHTESIAA